MDERLVVRGIYVHQLTLQNPKKLRYLIERSVEVGLNTLVVDLWGWSSRYDAGVQTIRAAGLHYVPRVTIFPHGGSPAQVADRSLWEKRWRLVEHAIELGARDVQLDYIRYSTKTPPSSDNANDILNVVRWFRERVTERGARLQIDVFGEVAYGPSMRIGQDMAKLAPELDAVCPMLYPSHFEPYVQRARNPYDTVYDALVALDAQTRKSPLSVYAYIESFNYRYPMSDEERIRYLEAQLDAVIDAKAEGYYVWSVGNHYDLLFEMLRRRQGRGQEAAVEVEPPVVATASFGPPPPPGWQPAMAGASLDASQKAPSEAGVVRAAADDRGAVPVRDGTFSRD